MACAFQSGTSSVYLEIQWWFIRAPEDPRTSEEEVEEGAEEEETEVITRYGATKWGMEKSLFLFCLFLSLSRSYYI